jgi:RNA polymerase sigma factor (TIGR02999 family)
MRQVLIEAARRRNAGKRGGQVAFADIDLVLTKTAFGGDELLALDQALLELERLEPRQAKLVESRFFGGLDVMETAELLEVSEATVHREWRAAKAWLKHKLRSAQ